MTDLHGTAQKQTSSMYFVKNKKKVLIFAVTYLCTYLKIQTVDSLTEVDVVNERNFLNWHEK